MWGQGTGLGPSGSRRSRELEVRAVGLDDRRQGEQPSGTSSGVDAQDAAPGSESLAGLQDDGPAHQGEVVEAIEIELEVVVGELDRARDHRPDGPGVEDPRVAVEPESLADGEGRRTLAVLTLD